MLKLLLHHYPGAIDKVKGDATIMHLISGLRIDVAARRLRGGGLEGEEVDRQRRLKRFHMLQVFCPRWSSRLRLHLLACSGRACKRCKN